MYRQAGPVTRRIACVRVTLTPLLSRYTSKDSKTDLSQNAEYMPRYCVIVHSALIEGVAYFKFPLSTVVP